MKHLIAYVRKLGDGLEPEWLGHVEFDLGDGKVEKRKVEGSSCIEAQRECERVADQHSFALDWSGGFVARGVEQDESVRGTGEKGEQGE